MRFSLRSKLHLILSVFGVLSVTLALFFSVHGISPQVSAASRPLQAFAGYTPAAVTSGQARLLSHHRGTDHLALTIGLPLRHQQALTQLLNEVNTPRSPLYRHYLTLAQANQAFNPMPQQERQVIEWLQSHGLRVTQTYPNHVLVDVTGTVAQIERLLQVMINDYTMPLEGKQITFYAPANAPTVDASVRSVISTIVGLDDYPRIHVDTSLPAPHPARNGTAHGVPPYYPQDFADSYDVNPLWNGGDTGVGQHIGIVLFAPPPSDTALTQFATQTGANVATQANGRLQVIPVGTDPVYLAGLLGAAEAAMDVEYTSAMAPGATIDYYPAPNTTQGNATDKGLEDALNQAGTDPRNNAQISNSWGQCEGADTPFINAVEPILQSNTLTGHTYLFSSGDHGSACVPTPDSQCKYPDLTPQYPASSAYVTSVGGTRFSGSINGSYPGETAWQYTPQCAIRINQPGGSGGGSHLPIGSGGGYSQLFAQPGWQGGVSKSTYRGYPDVAADADPATGAYICYDDPQQGATCSKPGTITGNGTSLATPLWAGMIADVNQYVLSQNERPLGFITPLLYMIANGSSYPAYHDITTGTNGQYTTGPGWDAVTGLGSPDLYNLARDAAKSYTDQPLGIAAVSATDVWAVGSYFKANVGDLTLIEHWDGTSWKVVPSPNPPSQQQDAQLFGVTAISANDVWAVGGYFDSTVGNQTLIERWDGTSWKVVPSPNPPSQQQDAQFFGVTAISANDVWAVGSYADSNLTQLTLIEHWDGTSWSVVPSPSPDSPCTFQENFCNYLSSAAAVSANDVWAVGEYEDSSGFPHNLIEHWDGTSWSVVPANSSGNELFGATAISANDVWAVGSNYSSTTQTEHWDGTSWKVVPSPNPGLSCHYCNYLSSAAAVSANDVWAVGYSVQATVDNQTLIEHWDGTSWNVVPSPNPGVGPSLTGVAAVSANDVWAVGNYFDGRGNKGTLIEHWDGSRWAVVPSPNP